MHEIHALVDDINLDLKYKRLLQAIIKAGTVKN